LDANWGMPFCIGATGLCTLYMVLGMYSGIKAGKGPVPHAEFWLNLAGLVKDGIVYSAGGQVQKHAEVMPRMDASNPGLHTGLMAGQVVTSDGGRRRRSRGSGNGADGKRRKKRPSGGDGKGERVVVIDPITGKKKVKRKVKRGSAPDTREASQGGHRKKKVSAPKVVRGGRKSTVNASLE